MTAVNYEDHVGLIWTFVRRFIREHGTKYGVPEEIRSVCNVGFAKALNEYDPTKGKFTTILGWKIRGELTQHLRDQRRYKRDGTSYGMRDAAIYEQPSPWSETVEELSEDARTVAKLILETPRELRMLGEDLNSTGWSWGRILTTFQEIREVLFEG